MVDLSKFIDNSLKSEFEAKPYDVAKDRAKLAARFTKAVGQFPSSTAPNKIWKLSNGVVEVKVSLGSGYLNIGGATTNYVPEGQFKGFISALIEATNAGEFDGALKAVDVASKAAPKASSSGKGKLETLTAVKRSLGRLKDKSDEGIRAHLESKGVREEWIVKAIAEKK